MIFRFCVCWGQAMNSSSISGRFRPVFGEICFCCFGVVFVCFGLALGVFGTVHLPPLQNQNLSNKIWQIRFGKIVNSWNLQKHTRFANCERQMLTFDECWFPSLTSRWSRTRTRTRNQRSLLDVPGSSAWPWWLCWLWSGWSRWWWRSWWWEGWRWLNKHLWNKQTHPYPRWMFSPRSERVLYPHSPGHTNYCIEIILKEVL